MKILLLVNSFPPEIRSASHLFYELSESLAIKGHKVTVITKIPKYNVVKLNKKYKGKLLMKEYMSEIRVLRSISLPLPQNIPLVRAFDEFFLSFTFFIRALFLKKQDIVLVYSPPLPLGLSAAFLKLFKRMPFVFNVQDIYPQTVIDLGLLRNRFLIRVARIMEKFIYKRAYLITVHSQGNLKHLTSSDVSPNKVKVIHNWVDTDSIKPGNRLNQFREKYSLDNNFIVSFAGVMGFAQDLETVIKAAKILKNYRKMKFVLIGEGAAKKGLQKNVKELDLKNVKFLSMQSREVYPQILAASDICLVTLKKTVKTPVVPGKIMSIMAAGRPIIGSFPLKGDAVKLIRKARAGIVIEAENSQKLAEAILKLYKNSELRRCFGKNGRNYAEENLSRKICVQKYEDLLLQIIKKKVNI